MEIAAGLSLLARHDYCCVVSADSLARWPTGSWDSGNLMNYICNFADSCEVKFRAKSLCLQARVPGPGYFYAYN